MSSLGFPFALHTPSTGKASNQKCQWAQKKEGKVNKGLLSLAKEPGKEQKLPSSNSSTEGAQQLAGTRVWAGRRAGSASEVKADGMDEMA